MDNQATYDTEEIRKFDQLADYWWDIDGELKTLHHINPVRLQFIQNHMHLAGQSILDIGCGGGILSESLARANAKVTAIDLSRPAINTAKQHAKQQNLTIDYRYTSLEDFAQQTTTPYDGIVCMELLEHIPNPADFIKTMSELLRPGGQLFLSTINRTFKAYCFAILGAEYLLQLLPKKTHDYNKFIRPAELSQWLRDANLHVNTLSGMSYNPLTHQAKLGANLEINYLVVAS